MKVSSERMQEIRNGLLQQKKSSQHQKNGAAGKPDIAAEKGPTCGLGEMPAGTAGVDQMQFDEGGDFSFSAPETYMEVHQVHPIDPTASAIDSAELAQDPGKATIEAAIVRLATDPGAVFTQEVIAALRVVKESDIAEFIRLRARIKAANKDALMGHLDREVNGTASEGEDQSLSDQLVEFVQGRATLFHDQDKNAFASFQAGDHLEVWRLDSQGFREWLGAEFYRDTRIIPKENPLKDACVALSGIAKYDGDQRDVFIRVARIANGYAVDLVDDEWQSIIIEPGSWRVDRGQSVPFRRTQTMRALPVPLAPGAGNIDLLWQFINCAEADRNMVLAWMLECWRYDTGFPVAEFVAEQGSGKSKSQYFARELLDPNQVNLRGRPKTIEDIYIGAANSWLSSFENLSHLTDDMQDAFCVLSTGGGFATRTLFTNSEETAIPVKRPIAMNGISVLATRQDLVDRLIHIAIQPIAPNQRKTDTELTELFEANRAAIFTGMLDLFARALEILPTVAIDELPRMADFALLGAAVYAARGVECPTEAFMRDYSGMRVESIHRTLDSSPLASAILSYLEHNPRGAELGNNQYALDALSKHKSEGDAWPKSGKGFADGVRRLAPALRAIGVKVEIAKHRGKHGYPVTISRTGDVGVLGVLGVHENKFSDAKKRSTPSDEVHHNIVEVIV